MSAPNSHDAPAPTPRTDALMVSFRAYGYAPIEKGHFQVVSLASSLEKELVHVAAQTATLRKMGDKVNAIRNSIIGMQGFNYSEHAYPLVAALDEAGFVGEDYPIARANLGTLIEQNAALEREVAELRKDRERLDWLEQTHAITLNQHGEANIVRFEYQFLGALRPAIDAALTRATPAKE